VAERDCETLHVLRSLMGATARCAMTIRPPFRPSGSETKARAADRHRTELSALAQHDARIADSELDVLAAARCVLALGDLGALDEVERQSI
jgi:hypothetical protein